MVSWILINNGLGNGLTVPNRNLKKNQLFYQLNLNKCLFSIFFVQENAFQKVYQMSAFCLVLVVIYVNEYKYYFLKIQFDNATTIVLATLPTFYIYLIRSKLGWVLLKLRSLIYQILQKYQINSEPWRLIFSLNL